MKALGIVFRLGLLVGSWGVFAGWHAAAQTPAPKEPQPPAPGSRKLTGDDARRAKELDKAIEAALKADRWEEAIARERNCSRCGRRSRGRSISRP